MSQNDSFVKKHKESSMMKLLYGGESTLITKLPLRDSIMTDTDKIDESDLSITNRVTEQFSNSFELR
jgi:hypothetical protein